MISLELPLSLLAGSSCAALASTEAHPDRQFVKIAGRPSRSETPGLSNSAGARLKEVWQGVLERYISEGAIGISTGDI